MILCIHQGAALSGRAPEKHTVQSNQSARVCASQPAIRCDPEAHWEGCMRVCVCVHMRPFAFRALSVLRILNFFTGRSLSSGDTLHVVAITAGTRHQSTEKTQYEHQFLRCFLYTGLFYLLYSSYPQLPSFGTKPQYRPPATPQGRFL